MYSFMAYLHADIHVCTHPHIPAHIYHPPPPHTHTQHKHASNQFVHIQTENKLIISFSKGLPSFMNISMKKMLIGLLTIILLCLFVVGTSILTTALDKTGGVFIMIISYTCLC